MAPIILISTSELPPVFMMTRILALNFVDIVRIRLERLVHYQTLKMTAINSPSPQALLHAPCGTIIDFKEFNL